MVNQDASRITKPPPVTWHVPASQMSEKPAADGELQKPTVKHRETVSKQTDLGTDQQRLRKPEAKHSLNQHGPAMTSVPEAGETAGRCGMGRRFRAPSSTASAAELSSTSRFRKVFSLLREGCQKLVVLQRDAVGSKRRSSVAVDF